jgi:hypothetical protein
MFGNGQEQKVGHQSTAIQATGNVTIGMNAMEVIALCKLLMENNFPKLREEARKVAEEYIKEFTEGIGRKIVENQELIDFNKFSEPDVQASLNDALQAAARRGPLSNTETLQELIINRILIGNTDFTNRVISEAILVVPKLTPMQISALTLIEAITMIRFTSDIIVNTESLSKSVFELASKCDGINYVEKLHIQYSGAGWNVSFERQDPVDVMYGLQTSNGIPSKELFEKAVKETCPNYLKLLDI